MPIPCNTNQSRGGTGTDAGVPRNYQTFELVNLEDEKDTKGGGVRFHIGVTPKKTPDREKEHPRKNKAQKTLNGESLHEETGGESATLTNRKHTPLKPGTL